MTVCRTTYFFLVLGAAPSIATAMFPVSEDFPLTFQNSLMSFLGTLIMGIVFPLIDVVRSKNKAGALRAIANPQILACEHPCSFVCAIGAAFALNGALAMLIVTFLPTAIYNAAFYTFCLGSGALLGSLLLVFCIGKLSINDTTD